MNKSLSFREKKPFLMMIMENYEDIMIDILLRLPLKSLLGCKCVSKWLNRLISQPFFVSCYTTRNPQFQVSGFFLQKFLFLQLSTKLEFIAVEGQDSVAFPEPTLSFIQDSDGVFIRHSCNGLMICSSFRCLESDRKYYICKPTTKQYQLLPKPKSETVYGVHLIYDPSISPHYKVLCVCGSRLSTYHRLVKLFDSASGSWKLSGNSALVPDDELLFNRGVFLNGSVHWVGRGDLALRFDLEEEEMIPMPMPLKPDGRSERRIGYFGKSGDHLYLIEVYGSQISFDLMEMESDYSGWFVKHHVNLGDLVAHYRLAGPHRLFSVLHLVRRQVGVDQDESHLVLHIPGRFLYYHLKDGTFMELHNSSNEVLTVDKGLGLWYSWDVVHPYTNTLCYL